MTLFCSRLLLVLGCLGLILSSGKGQPSNGAVQINAICKKQTCNKTATIKLHSSCPLEDKSGGYSNCKFDEAQNDLIWCDAMEESNCTLKKGTTPNKCVGYCENVPGWTCATTEYNVCVQP